MRKTGALLLLAALPATALAAADTAPPPACPGIATLPEGATDEDRRITCEIPGPLRREVIDAELRGHRLRNHDLAAWLSTDALQELHAFDDLGGKPNGWVTTEIEGGIGIRYFLRQDDGQLFAFASAVLDGERMEIRDAKPLKPLEPADARELRLLKARATALAEDRLQCTSTVNTVILEEPGLDQVRVYVFSAWNEQAAPLGGHSRLLVSSDGSKLLDSFQQTKTCLNYPSKLDPKGMLLVSDLHSGPPSELQVFLQRQYGVPLVVRTFDEDMVWKIDEGLMHLLPTGDPLRESVMDAERK